MPQKTLLSESTNISEETFEKGNEFIDHIFSQEPEIASLLKECKITASKELDPQIGKKIAEVIRGNSSTYDIAKILNENKFLNVNKETVREIKTQIYFARLDENIREIIRKAKPNFFAEKTSHWNFTAPKSLLKSADPIDSIIEGINMAYEARNYEKLSGYLQPMLDPDQVNDVMTKIAGLAPSPTPKPMAQKKKSETDY